MKLYEFEGHNILNRVGIDSPNFVVCENLDEVRQAQKRVGFPIAAKVQVLSGKRSKRGGVKICKDENELEGFCKKYFGADFDAEEIKYITLFEAVKIEAELYASITYDTVLKIPFLLYCSNGGVDIEEVQEENPKIVKRVDIDPEIGLLEKDLKEITNDTKLMDFLLRLWDAFSKFDCRLVEVNPIAKTTEGYKALDAKVILDDNGLARQTELNVLSKGSAGAIPTNREIEARKIDAEDYRGSAGSTFIEFDGDIAILASGGGASLLVMDAVVSAGGRPANYTEYSGNPPREKVEKLTKIALDKKDLAGCLVAGAFANFTDIYETLSGFADGLVNISPKVNFPIVVRRGGPKQKEAYDMLMALAREKGFDIHLFGPEIPISVACQKMVELSSVFKKGKN